MTALTPEGHRIVADIASRHGISEGSATHMLIAVSNGGGRQAQFNLSELGGMGQWSQGGMTMVGNMFDTGLKARVDAICRDLAAALPDTIVFASQSQSQSGGGQLRPHTASSLFVPEQSRPDWPAGLGTPASQGSQNDMRYAWFPDARRLAVSVGGRVTLYDTGDHRIGGAAQAQGGGQSLTFTSQSGTVSLTDLTQVPDDQASAATPPPRPEAPPAPPAAAVVAPAPDTDPAPPAPTPDRSAPAAQMTDEQIFARLERLADFRDRGILDDAEFAAKKAELLSRL